VYKRQVINRGHVEQIGTAKEVYEHPDSKFVASFIGKVNVLDSIVKNNQIIIKDTPFKIAHQTDEPLNDGNIVLLIRPEDLKIVNESKDSNALPCTIQRIHYRGSHYEIDCHIKKHYIKIIEDKNNLSKQSWRENQRAFLSIKSYRIFRAEQGHQSVHEKLKELGYIE